MEFPDAREIYKEKCIIFTYIIKIHACLYHSAPHKTCYALAVPYERSNYI